MNRETLIFLLVLPVWLVVVVLTMPLLVVLASLHSVRKTINNS